MSFDKLKLLQFIKEKSKLPSDIYDDADILRDYMKTKKLPNETNRK